MSSEQTQHKPGEVWKHRKRDRTVRVLKHDVRTDNVTVEPVGAVRKRTSVIYGYNLRDTYARVDETGIIGPVVGAEPAAMRLVRSLDYRTIPGVEPISTKQVAVVLHALADHTSIQKALEHEPDPGSPWPQATSLGRWYHDVADQAEAIHPAIERTRTADEIQSAADLCAFADAAGMPSTFWGTDRRIRRALDTLGITPDQARVIEWTNIEEWDPALVADDGE